MSAVPSEGQRMERKGSVVRREGEIEGWRREG